MKAPKKSSKKVIEPVKKKGRPTNAEIEARIQAQKEAERLIKEQMIKARTMGESTMTTTPTGVDVPVYVAPRRSVASTPVAGVSVPHKAITSLVPDEEPKAKELPIGATEYDTWWGKASFVNIFQEEERVELIPAVLVGQENNQKGTVKVQKIGNANVLVHWDNGTSDWRHADVLQRLY